MALKLHTCGMPGVGIGPHPCNKVKKALDESGVEYELVKHPTFPRGRRKQVKEMTGQDRLPFFEFDDGTVLREESAQLAERARTGRLSPQS